MSDFIKKVKATYLKLYQQKYGRTDTAFLDPHFILWDDLSAEMSKPHWGDRSCKFFYKFRGKAIA